MKNTIVSENRKKLKNYSFFRLLCFAMFCFWQMGFIYFMGPSLTINGRTPLPVSMDNITTLIVAAYVLSIMFMLLLPHKVIWAQRITAVISLIAALGLFMPFSDEILRILIYTQVFACCFMIGFETFVMVNFFSEENAITHLTAAYGISLLLIAGVQNDFVPVTFPVFRLLTVIALVFLIMFFFKLPAQKEYCPRYVKKNDGITRPKKLLFGTYILIFISALMAVSGPSISGEVRHGVFITYAVDAAASLVMYLLYKKINVHPFRMISVCMGIGCVGFLFMFAATQISVLSYFACVFIGVGMLPCQMLPLYGVVLMKSYPSRFFSPVTILLALMAVLVQSSVVEVFRTMQSMVYLVYALIMVILAIIYIQIEPFLLYNFKRKMQDDEVPEIKADTRAEKNTLLDCLSKRELEVVDLIAAGYRNADIAKMLFISVHTVNDHTKNIYRKLDVHSRFELTALVNKNNA